MTKNESDKHLKAIEEAQEQLRENIEESKKLVRKTQQLLKTVNSGR